MEKTEQIVKLRSLELFLSAHPENEPNSEMEDRLDDVRELIKSIRHDIVSINNVNDLDIFHAANEHGKSAGAGFIKDLSDLLSKVAADSFIKGAKFYEKKLKVN